MYDRQYIAKYRVWLKRNLRQKGCNVTPQAATVHLEMLAVTFGIICIIPDSKMLPYPFC